jgi:hypothetical protein
MKRVNNVLAGFRVKFCVAFCLFSPKFQKNGPGSFLVAAQPSGHIFSYLNPMCEGGRAA